MVSLLVQRQQREAAQRKERLAAARSAAAALSVQHARGYAAQKRQQQHAIEEDARQLWLRAQEEQLTCVDALVDRAMQHQGEGQTAAAQQQANVQHAACAEAVAWQAEHDLEAARHRLAVAFTRVEQHEAQKPLQEAQRRRERVRRVESQRAARVAAAPSPALPLAAVMRSLQAAPRNTSVRGAPIPVCHSREVSPHGNEGVKRAGSTSPPAVRPWRMSDVAPHVRVTVHSPNSHLGRHHSKESKNAFNGEDEMIAAVRDFGEEEHLAEEEEGGAADEAEPTVQRDTHLYAQECVDVQTYKEKALAEGQEKAAQRAAAALRRQHEERVQAEAQRRSQRERLAAVRSAYRNPRTDAHEEEEDHADGGGDDEDARHRFAEHTDKAVASAEAFHSGTANAGAVSMDASTGAPSAYLPQMQGPPRAPSQQQPSAHALTRQQQAQNVYREGEAAFTSTFVDGPPVMVQAAGGRARQAPLQTLLRPAHIADLLYDVTQTVNEGVTTEMRGQGLSPSAGLTHVNTAGDASNREGPANFAAARVRVLPSAPLHMRSLNDASDVSPVNAGPESNHEPAPQEQQQQQKLPQRASPCPSSSQARSVAQPAEANTPPARQNKERMDAGEAQISGGLSHAQPQPFEREARVGQALSPLPSRDVSGATPHALPVDDNTRCVPPFSAPLTAPQQSQQLQDVPLLHEEIAMSPLTPAHHAPTPAQTPHRFVAAGVPMQTMHDVPEQQASVRSSTSISAATSPQCTPERRPHAPSPSTSLTSSYTSSSPTSSSSSSPTMSEAASEPLHARSDRSTDTSGFSSSNSGSSITDTSAASSSARHPLPTMTAEQLKLALMRLRSRMAAPQQ